MSAPNFWTMENFPLIAVAENPNCKVCPDCGLTCGADEKECPDCGTSLESVQEQYDEIAAMDMISEMERVANDINEYLHFHKVIVKGGYFAGVQFYVEDCFHGYDDIEDMDNEDANYYYGMCRSKMLRKYKSESNFICRRLRKAANEYGLVELVVTALFSNGEAWYSKVDPQKGLTVRDAAKMMVA